MGRSPLPKSNSNQDRIDAAKKRRRESGDGPYDYARTGTPRCRNEEVYIGLAKQRERGDDTTSKDFIVTNSGVREKLKNDAARGNYAKRKSAKKEKEKASAEKQKKLENEIKTLQSEILVYREKLGLAPAKSAQTRSRGSPAPAAKRKTATGSPPAQSKRVTRSKTPVTRSKTPATRSITKYRQYQENQ